MCVRFIQSGTNGPTASDAARNAAVAVFKRAPELTHIQTMFTRSIASCGRFRRLYLNENGQVLDDVNAQIGLDPQCTFEEVFAGNFFSAAISKDGDLHIWGGLHHGLLSAVSSTNEPIQYTPPVCIPRVTFGNSPVRQVALGDLHVLVVTEAGRLYTGGYGGEGRLGSGVIVFDQQLGPNPLTHVAVADAHVTGVAAGPSSSCFVARDGRFFTFGQNYMGECASGDFDVRWSPAPLPGFGAGAGETKAAQASMHLHVAVLDADGFLHTAGRNSSGELGTGDREDRLLLSRVESGAMRMVACGLRHTLALDRLGCVWVCGSNSSGTLGMGAAGDETGSVCVLQRVEGLSDVVLVTAGIGCSMAVVSNGTVFEWGFSRSRASDALWWPGSTDTGITYTCVPTPQAIALPARVGRYDLPLHPLLALALAMGAHTRLGASSPLSTFSADTLRQVAEACVARDPLEVAEARAYT